MTREPIVLVGVDGSDASFGAIDWAVKEAAQLGWGVKLVCAYSLPAFSATSMDGGYGVMDESQLVAGSESIIAQAVARAGTEVPVTSQVIAGDPTHVLAELSKTASMVVIGKHRGGGLANRLLGAVSSSLPPLAHCSTVVVPYRATDSQARGPVKRIVVGVDNSDSAKGALRRAIREARIWDAELTAFAAVTIIQGAGAFAFMPPSTDHDEILASVKEGLDVTVAQALAESESDITVRRHALDGSAAALLTEFSTAVDLVVVGTRGRGGFAGLLLGSTSQAVMSHSSCPVMVVPTRVTDDFPSEFPWQK